MQEHVYKTRVRDTSDLKQHLVDEAVGQWRKQLCASVKAKGHHFEHVLN